MVSYSTIREFLQQIIKGRIGMNSSTAVYSTKILLQILKGKRLEIGRATFKLRSGDAIACKPKKWLDTFMRSLQLGSPTLSISWGYSGDILEMQLHASQRNDSTLLSTRSRLSSTETTINFQSWEMFHWHQKQEHWILTAWLLVQSAFGIQVHYKHLDFLQISFWR